MARVPRYEPDIALTRLETVRASRAAVDQRRGRAGRTEPGVCYRLWDEPQTASLAAYTQPEILSADLSSLVLDLAQWGVADPAGLAFLDPPPAPALKEAKSLLSELGALDADGRITDGGPQPARAGAAAAAGAHDRGFQPVRLGRRGRRDRCRPHRAWPRRRRRRSRCAAGSIPSRPFAALLQCPRSRAALGAAGNIGGAAEGRGRSLHRAHARLRLPRSRRKKSRQWQLCARQRSRRRGRANVRAGARALHRRR